MKTKEGCICPEPELNNAHLDAYTRENIAYLNLMITMRCKVHHPEYYEDSPTAEK